ncbi:MAG: hypothetical protein R6W90_10290 [Ignavibacteriaceae bacterium]
MVVFNNTGYVLRGGYFVFKTNYLNPFPLPDIHSNDHKEVLKLISDLVINVINLKRFIEAAETPQEKTALQRQIKAADRQIDQLVYQLYGLTEEEIEIVEGE